MVPLNISHFKNFAATINLYNHPNNAPNSFKKNSFITTIATYFH